MLTAAMNAWLQELGARLDSLFPKRANKLAFMAYTGKVENHVRDELAYALHAGRRRNGEDLVGRELRRIDLVAFGNGRPTHALQAKAMYVGDFYEGRPLNAPPARKKPHSLLMDLRNDIRLRAQHVSLPPDKAKHPLTAVGLLLVTDFQQPAEHGSVPDLLGTAAYPNLVKRQSRAHTQLKWDVLLNNHLKSLKLQAARKGSWSGYANGCNVTVHWLLVHRNSSLQPVVLP